MVDDELPADTNGDAVTPPGPRRSTFTPPPATASYDPSATDDDALAGALSDQFQRWVPLAGPAVPPESAHVSTPQADAVASGRETELVVGSASVPAPPQRLSLTDEQLVAAANLDAPGHDTGALLDMVERELQLRQAEALRLAQWEEQVRSSAGPEADALVSRVRSQFTGVIPVIDTTPPPVSSDTPAAEPLRGDGAMAAALPYLGETSSGGETLTVAEQLAVAPPPQVETAAEAPLAPPVIDLAHADAPPPYRAVLFEAVPPAVSPPTAESSPAESYAVESSPVEPLIEPAPPAVGDPGLITAPTSLEALWAATAASHPMATSNAAGTPNAADTDFGVVGADGADGVRSADGGPAAMLSASASASASSSEFDQLLAARNIDDETSATGSGQITAAAHDGDHQHRAELQLAQDAEVGPPRAWQVESNSLQPTAAQQRVGRSIRLFWLWFAVNSSVVTIALGAVIVGLGVSLRQAVLAALIGVTLSFLPLGLGTLAGKWSGQPTMVVSRATFGMAGNVIPAVLSVVTRIVWAAALVWILAAGVAEVLLGARLVDETWRVELTAAVAVAGLVVAAVIAGLGFGMIAVVSAVVSAVSAVLVVGLIVLTAPFVDLGVALSVPDGEWMLMISGAVLVFSVVGLAWANSSGDLARYQARATYGSSAVLFTAFGATIPAFALVSWGALLAASNPVLSDGLRSNPVDLLSRLLPLWYPAPLIAAVALSVIAAAAVALYSGGFALLSTGIRSSRPVAVVIAVILTGAAVAVLLLVVSDISELFRDVVTTLAVPVAAWAGIFGAETMIRTRRVHSPSLLRAGGVYPAIRWVNLVMLVVITAVGWGLSTAVVVGLQWQGYLFSVVGVDTADALAASDPGVLVALLLGLLTPLIAGVPALRRLQAAERVAADNDEPREEVVAVAQTVLHAAPVPFTFSPASFPSPASPASPE